MKYSRKKAPQTFAERLIERRTKIGISQAELSRRIECEQQTVANWESGRTGATSRILALARALHTTPEWLQHGEGRANTHAEDAAGEMLDVLRLVAADPKANLNGYLARSVAHVIAKAEGRA